MDFVRSHLGKMNLWPIEHFFEHIFHHFWVGLLLHLMDPPILMTNMLKKVFNWSEVHLSDVTCYKIHTLDTLTHWMRSLTSKKLNIVKRTSLGKSSNCSSDIFDDWEFKSLTWNISTFQLFNFFVEASVWLWLPQSVQSSRVNIKSSFSYQPEILGEFFLWSVF